MPKYFIDEDYYIDEYEGDSTGDIDALNFLIRKASRAIESLIGYKHTPETIELIGGLLEATVKRATAELVEHYNQYKVFEQDNDSLEDVSIGAFSYSERESGTTSQDIIPPTVIQTLARTGLLYNGVDVR